MAQWATVVVAFRILLFRYLATRVAKIFFVVLLFMMKKKKKKKVLAGFLYNHPKPLRQRKMQLVLQLHLQQIGDGVCCGSKPEATHARRHPTMTRVRPDPAQRDSKPN